MTYRIIIEPTAEREIRSAVRWKTENASPAVAARRYSGLIRKIETLRRHPTRCPLAAESVKFEEEIRELLHGGEASGHIVTGSYSLSAKIRSTSFLSATPPATKWSPETRSYPTRPANSPDSRTPRETLPSAGPCGMDRPSRPRARTRRSGGRPAGPDRTGPGQSGGPADRRAGWTGP